MSVLLQLEQWYESQCDGDWEHHFGVSIGTLDNPGWTVTIDLNGTGLENLMFPTFEDLAPTQNWIKCWVEDGKFYGVGGPQKLEEILAAFLRWATKESVK
jgi:immunity protein 53 of polymorphic toxin system